ncbi:AAA family ATPase [Falsibacillus albus]|uniref:ATP-binding protein n=1 Tax=Falsibacillus albus TaxID=2478915 RepID=A0A3L7JZ80_9BACI|nr:AAA family ATPase [Falsibacillus albus]RLQ93692.1 ATP-binding protein [Falsibacillus albus]
MKRLAILTVGKTHSGKMTFARSLEKELSNSIVIDQDHQAEFLNMYYRQLQPKKGPNTIKHALSKVIVDHAVKKTDLHVIVCNSNRSRKDRLQLLDKCFKNTKFVRILVHFDIPDGVLQHRVTQSQRSTNIFRGAATNFEELLIQQQADSLKEDVTEPVEGEADHLFVIKDNEEGEAVISRIIELSQD